MSEKLTVYFDGACPVCSAEIALYRRRPGAEALDFVDATTCPPEALGEGLTRTAALARIHARGPDGAMLSGARAFAAIWRRLPGFRGLGAVVGHPLVAPVAEVGYRLFLRVRRLWRPG